jgi:hypothetical protein
MKAPAEVCQGCWTRPEEAEVDGQSVPEARSAHSSRWPARWGGRRWARQSPRGGGSGRGGRGPRGRWRWGWATSHSHAYFNVCKQQSYIPWPSCQERHCRSPTFARVDVQLIWSIFINASLEATFLDELQQSWRVLNVYCMSLDTSLLKLGIES